MKLSRKRAQELDQLGVTPYNTYIGPKEHGQKLVTEGAEGQWGDLID